MKISIPEGIKGLVFDLDGTLIDTMPAHFLCWQEISKKYDFDFSENLFYELAGRPAKRIVEHINKTQNKNLDKIQIDNEKEELYLKYLPELKLVNPVVEVAKFAKKIAMPIAIGTGARRDIAIMTLEATKLNNLFEIMICSEDVKEHKPHPDTFLACAKAMNIHAHECLVFEDAEFGFEAAKRAGMKFIDVRPFYSR